MLTKDSSKFKFQKLLSRTGFLRYVFLFWISSTFPELYELIIQRWNDLKFVSWYSSWTRRRSLISLNFSFSSCVTVPTPSDLEFTMNQSDPSAVSGSRDNISPQKSSRIVSDGSLQTSLFFYPSCCSSLCCCIFATTLVRGASMFCTKWIKC